MVLATLVTPLIIRTNNKELIIMNVTSLIALISTHVKPAFSSSHKCRGSISPVGAAASASVGY